MKEVRCPLCGEKEKKFYCHAPNNQNPSDQFTIVQCHGCDFFYLNPVPEKDAIAGYYPKYYWVGEKKKFIETIFPFIFFASKEKARYIKKYKEQGTILDVGCAEGFFINHMKKKGWSVTGIDFSKQAILYGQNNFGLECYAGEVTELKKKINKKFDVITLWATLEHVYDPIETLHAAHALLKEDGLLIFAVPNMASLQAKIFGKYWLHLDVPRHLCFFTPKTVKFLCEKTGFTIHDISYQSVEHNPGGWVYSALYYLREKKKKKSDEKIQEKIISESDISSSKEETKKKSALKKIFYWSIDNLVIPFFVPVAYIESTLKKGGTITIIAKKKTV